MIMFGKKSCLLKKLSVVALATTVIVITCGQLSYVKAQDLWPLDDNPLSPLSYFPLLRGEAKFSLFVPTMKSGDFEDVGAEKRGLKNFYKIDGGDSVFLDLMVRFQLGRFSSRTYFERREFVGHRRELGRNLADATLDYWGWREGFDVDIFLGNKSRVGFNIDYSFYGPTFTVFNPDSDNSRPRRVIGPQYSGTVGVHGLYNPVWNLFGMSVVAEAWAHWPIFGTSLTDYEFSGGLKSPDTVLGAFSLKAGYRSTSISFSEQTQGNVSSTWDGVFGEIAYYYH